MTQPLLKIPEVARQLGFHQRTIRRWIKEGAIRAVRVGNEWRFHQADIDEYVGKPVATEGSAPAASTAGSVHIGPNGVPRRVT